MPDENAKLVWDELYADEANGIVSPSDVYGVDYYFDGEKIEDYARDPAEGDAKVSSDRGERDPCGQFRIWLSVHLPVYRRHAG